MSRATETAGAEPPRSRHGAAPYPRPRRRRRRCRRLRSGAGAAIQRWLHHFGFFSLSCEFRSSKCSVKRNLTLVRLSIKHACRAAAAERPPGVNNVLISFKCIFNCLFLIGRSTKDACRAAAELAQQGGTLQVPREFEFTSIETVL